MKPKRAVIDRLFQNCLIFLIIGLAAISISMVGHSSGKSEPALRDSVIILEKKYEVPPPWFGRRLGNKTSSKPKNLVMLPLKYGFDSSRIYVTSETKKAFLKMATAAEKDNITIYARSGYRSFWYQKQIFEKRMLEGKSFKKIASMVAPPGYSDHMTGKAMDLATTTSPFAKSEAYQWLKKNAGHFGFIESYPKDSSSFFHWEPWHWKYDDSEINIENTNK